MKPKAARTLSGTFARPRPTRDLSWPEDCDEQHDLLLCGPGPMDLGRSPGAGLAPAADDDRALAIAAAQAAGRRCPLRMSRAELRNRVSADVRRHTPSHLLPEQTLSTLRSPLTRKDGAHRKWRPGLAVAPVSV
jgi:hypothetical protein